MDTVSFGSFPRSGGHFFIYLAKCDWISHSISKLNNKNNIVVSIRTPLECVPSWVALTDDIRIDRAEKVLEWYCAYYQKCREVGVLIIPFTQLVFEPLFCLNYVLKTFGLPLVDSVEFDLNTGFHSPTADKSGYGVIIDEMSLAPSFPRAMSLFEELCVPLADVCTNRRVTKFLNSSTK